MSTTPLHDAASDGRIINVQDLITKGADVQANDDDGGTALHCAAMWGTERHNEAAQLLITNGADVNAKNNEGETPPLRLHLAAMGGRKETAQLLFTNGADVTAKDDDGKTPLDYAEKKGFEETARVLAPA